MNNIETLIKKFFDRFFLNQHPETALRYYPLVSQIKKSKLEDSKILEVGSGSLGITPYLRKKIDAVDVDFSGPQTDLINQIKNSAVKLPFRKNSYDVAISADTLEHIPKKDRQQAIEEMLRVAKKIAIIAVPLGDLSEIQDRQLDIYWKKTFKSRNQFLKEHVENGLPKSDEILVEIDKSLRKLDKNAKVKSFPNLNLKVRKVLMLTWISKNKVLYYLYLKGYLIFLPVLKHANFGNCYRRIFVIEFSP